MRSYKIIVEEVISKAVTIEATSAEEAMESVERMYRNSELVLDGDATVTHKQMCIESPEDEQTEWTSF